MEPQLRLINPLEDSEWDNMVGAVPGATVFHSASWMAVLSESYGHKPIYLAATNGRQVQATLPLAEVDTWLKGRRGICLPFADECSALVSASATEENRQWLQELFTTASNLGRERAWKYLEIRGNIAAWEVPSSLSFYSHSADLRPNEEQIFARCESSVRRAIKKAKSAGVTTRIERAPAGLKIFYELHCRTRKRHGLPPQPRTFFNAIQRHVIDQGRGFVVLGEHANRSIAAAVYFHFGKEGIYKFGASDEEFQHLRGNNAVMWEGFREAKRVGVERLSLGRTSLWNDGLRRFKKGWGTKEDLLGYIKYDVTNQKGLMDVDKTEGMHNILFRLLPKWLSETAGSLIYPQIA
jgi:hypothetical protein